MQVHAVRDMCLRCGSFRTKWFNQNEITSGFTTLLMQYQQQELAGAMEAGDSQKFADSLAEFDSMTRLDVWKTSLLLKVSMARSCRSSTLSVRDVIAPQVKHKRVSCRLARSL